MVRLTLKVILLLICLLAHLLSAIALPERIAINYYIVVDACPVTIKYVMLLVWIPTDNRLYILNIVCANYGRV